MKFVNVLFLVVLATIYTSGQPVADQSTPEPDQFIKLIKEIESSAFFPALTLTRRLMTFELLSAAETRHLKDLMDRLGYITILEYLDDLPEDNQHRFIEYSVDHLKDEMEYYGYKE